MFIFFFKLFQKTEASENEERNREKNTEIMKKALTFLAAPLQAALQCCLQDFIWKLNGYFSEIMGGLTIPSLTFCIKINFNIQPEGKLIKSNILVSSLVTQAILERLLGRLKK